MSNKPVLIFVNGGIVRRPNPKSVETGNYIDSDVFIANANISLDSPVATILEHDYYKDVLLPQETEGKVIALVNDVPVVVDKTVLVESVNSTTYHNLYNNFGFNKWGALEMVADGLHPLLTNITDVTQRTGLIYGIKSLLRKAESEDLLDKSNPTTDTNFKTMLGGLKAITLLTDVEHDNIYNFEAL